MPVLFVAALVIAAVVIFSVQNAVPVSVTLLTWQFGASLAVIVFLAFVVGIIATVLFSLALRFGRRARRRTRKAESLRIDHSF
jgi:lipopolysaccharide assembly protein A